MSGCTPEIGALGLGREPYCPACEGEFGCSVYDVLGGDVSHNRVLLLVYEGTDLPGWVVAIWSVSAGKVRG